MRKSLVLIALCILVSAFVYAEDVNPYETKQLPQLTSNVALDTEGITRTYLYCSWHIDDLGEEATLMNGETCPASPIVYTFEDDQTYYVRIDYANIGYGQISQQWELINTGNAGELTRDYNLNIPEPPQSLFDLMYSAIYGFVKNAICGLFPFLGICT